MANGYGAVGQNTVRKEHFTSLYSRAREEALTPKNVKAGWARAGLFPFNPDRVFREIQKSCKELDIPKANEVIVETSLHGEVLQTPVTAEAFISLHGLIQRDADTQDETSKERLLTHLQKFSKAAQMSIAECALLKDENRLLFEQNNEAKARRLVKSEIVGRAKVVKYEDVVIEREKRAAKQADAAAKKRGRKRKSPATVKAKPKKARRSEIEVAEDEIVAEGMNEYCSVFQASAVVSHV
jgi:hypothetical protein